MNEMRVAVAPIRGVQFRDQTANGDGSWTVSGHAAVFDQETQLYDGTYSAMYESIAPGAFDQVLARNPVVHLNLGHDMNRSVAATDVPLGDMGSLMLRSDGEGLSYLARVDREDPDAVAMCVKMRNGVIRQASFAFTIDDQELEERTADNGKVNTYRRILRVGDLYDVCVLPQGAYPQTSAAVRGIFRGVGHPGDWGPSHQPGDRGAFPISEPPGEGGQEKQSASRQRALAKAKLARFHFPVQEQ